MKKARFPHLFDLGLRIVSALEAVSLVFAALQTLPARADSGPDPQTPPAPGIPGIPGGVKPAGTGGTLQTQPVPETPRSLVLLASRAASSRPVSTPFSLCPAASHST